MISRFDSFLQFPAEYANFVDLDELPSDDELEFELESDELSELLDELRSDMSVVQELKRV